MDSKPGQVEPIRFSRLYASVLNFFLLFLRPRVFCHFRWSSTAHDAFKYRGLFAPNQFTSIYGRVSARYKYHELQQHEQKIRTFDLDDSLALTVRQTGNSAFYDAILLPSHIEGKAERQSTSYEADLTLLQDISTPSTSADYVHKHVYLSREKEDEKEEHAKLARATYLAGFSRAVKASDFDDWERLRSELRAGKHLAPALEDTQGPKTLAVAISYKGNKTEITRRMRLVDGGGDPVSGERMERETKVMTSDFVDDFRWSQTVRTCNALAARRGATHVRLWVDRLIGMGLSKEQNIARYEKLEWEEYGLFSYCVCPVVRVYDQDEVLFGTDFWRKLETVLGVAGGGLMVDDYMLRKFDNTIFFESSMYERLGDGVSLIGGGGKYFRSVTLALATAILTDGVSVSAVNEDIRTINAVQGWKAWALRTIAEGAYSASHSCMLRREPAFEVGKQQFMTLAFWESLVVECNHLIGRSYLDMSYQRSMSWRKSSCWDGVLEWIGMIPMSCTIRDKDEIRQFLNENVKTEAWTAPSGHAAVHLKLRILGGRYRRSLVVNLARFSTISEGHVIAVAEATGLRGKSLVPEYLTFTPLPDLDQAVTVQKLITGKHTRAVVFAYQPMKVQLFFMPVLKKILLVLIPLLLIIIAAIVKGVIGVILGFSGAISLIFVIIWFISRGRCWLWFDYSDAGEGLFDNLLLHALYKAGIKRIYRKLRPAKYSEIGWTGSDWCPGQQSKQC